MKFRLLIVKALLFSIPSFLLLYFTDVNLVRATTISLTIAYIIFQIDLLFEPISNYFYFYDKKNLKEKSKKRHYIKLFLYFLKFILFYGSPLFALFIDVLFDKMNSLFITQNTVDIFLTVTSIFITLIGSFVILSIEQKYPLLIYFFWFITVLLLIPVAVNLVENTILVKISAIIFSISFLATILSQIDKIIREKYLEYIKTWRRICDILSFGIANK